MRQYIGLEFGQMYRRFGSKVTILQREAHLIPREDEIFPMPFARSSSGKVSRFA